MSKRKKSNLLSQYVSGYKRYQYLVAVFALLQILTSVGMALSLKVILDNALMQRKIEFLIVGCLGYLLCAICNVWFTVTKQKNVSKIGEGAIEKMRSDIICHYLKLPVLAQYKIKSGNLLTLCMQDTDALKVIISTRYARRITNAITVSVLLASMLFLNLKFSFIVIAGMPAFLLIIFFFGSKLQKSEKSFMQKNESLSQFVTQTSAGAEVIKHLDASEPMQHTFAKKVQYLKEATLSKRTIESMKNVSGNFLSIAFAGVFTILGGFLLIKYKTGTPGIFISFLTLIPVLYNALVDAISLHLEERRSAINVDRMNEIFNTPIEKNGNLDAPKQSIEINVEHVSFGFNGRDVLKDINFKVMPGEKIAIVGESGSGKSTLAYLLAGLYEPQSGKVLYNNYPLANYSKEARGIMISMMEQEPFFFEDTIQTIICGTQEVDDVRMKKIAAKIGLDADVSNLPEGYSSHMSERTELSGGQKQRLALARLLYSPKQILIFDEPTSAMDKVSQDKLLQLFHEELVDQTVFIVTHSKSLAAKADRVIQMADGKCIYDGPAELFSMNDTLRGNAL